MCRKTFEVQYVCQHVLRWSSYVPTCNGVLHYFIYDSRRNCASCAMERLPCLRTEYQEHVHYFGANFCNPYRHPLAAIYPTQDHSLGPNTTCPEWKKRYHYHTRTWAWRTSFLNQGAIDQARAFENVGQKLHSANFEFDEDSPGNGLFAPIEFENLPRDDNGKVLASHQSCAICLEDFLPADGADAHHNVMPNPSSSTTVEDNEPGPKSGLRQLPCPKKHVFCLSCYRKYLTNTIGLESTSDHGVMGEKSAFGEVSCLLCFAPFYVKVREKRTCWTRASWILDRAAYVDPALPRDTSWFAKGSPSMVFSSTSMLLIAMPTFWAVEQLMHVWPESAYGNGRALPEQRMLVELGLFFLQVWSVLTAPLLLPSLYAAWLSFRFYLRMRRVIRKVVRATYYLWAPIHARLPDPSIVTGTSGKFVAIVLGIWVWIL